MGNTHCISMACALVATLTAMPTSEAKAQAGGVHFKVAFDLSVDCDQPTELHGIPARGEASGVLNTDRTASADLTLTAISTSVIYFDTSLGGAPRPAPGGSSIINVVGRNRLRLTWDLPNNQIIATIDVIGHTCAALLDFKLKYGNRMYSMFNGQNFYFCQKPHLLGSSCTVQ